MPCDHAWVPRKLYYLFCQLVLYCCVKPRGWVCYSILASCLGHSAQWHLSFIHPAHKELVDTFELCRNWGEPGAISLQFHLETPENPCGFFKDRRGNGIAGGRLRLGSRRWIHCPASQCPCDGCLSSAGCWTAALSHWLMGHQSPSGKGLSDPFLSFPIIQEGLYSFWWVRFIFSFSWEECSDCKDWQSAAVHCWRGLQPPSLNVWKNSLMCLHRQLFRLR